jgi:hypothetical protein
VNTTLTINSGGGTYILYLRGNANGFIAVELPVPSGWTSGGAVTLSVLQYVSGTGTLIGSTSVPLHNGDTVNRVRGGFSRGSPDSVN